VISKFHVDEYLTKTTSLSDVYLLCYGLVDHHLSLISFLFFFFLFAQVQPVMDILTSSDLTVAS